MGFVAVGDFVVCGCGANWMPLGPLSSGSTIPRRLEI